MRSLVRPELPTASVVHCVAMRRTPAAVDNSAPSATRPQSTYKSGKAVQTSGATSTGQMGARHYRPRAGVHHRQRGVKCPSDPQRPWPLDMLARCLGCNSVGRYRESYVRTRRDPGGERAKSIGGLVTTISPWVTSLPRRLLERSQSIRQEAIAEHMATIREAADSVEALRSKIVRIAENAEVSVP